MKFSTHFSQCLETLLEGRGEKAILHGISSGIKGFVGLGTGEILMLS
jgi:hypothetical protein